MFAFFKGHNLDQKELYWQLTSLFKQYNPILLHKNRLAGIYSIHVNDICAYVGQSKNLANRLSTHLSGKYNLDAVEVRVYLFGQEEYKNFYSKNDGFQTRYLELVESMFIQFYKPTENIIADYSLSENDLYIDFINRNCMNEKIPGDIEIEKKNGYFFAGSFNDCDFKESLKMKSRMAQTLFVDLKQMLGQNNNES